MAVGQGVLGRGEGAPGRPERLVRAEPPVLGPRAVLRTPRAVGGEVGGKNDRRDGGGRAEKRARAGTNVRENGGGDAAKKRRAGRGDLLEKPLPGGRRLGQNSREQDTADARDQKSGFGEKAGFRRELAECARAVVRLPHQAGGRPQRRDRQAPPDPPLSLAHALPHPERGRPVRRDQDSRTGRRREDCGGRHHCGAHGGPGDADF
mmetsp:Transcript_26955/g.67916  ORF Transcript_26955/g.67916 Transcript_26955/m.67916 type:complete len:206 (+) Transcript_26955:254-871(+)